MGGEGSGESQANLDPKRPEVSLMEQYETSVPPINTNPEEFVSKYEASASKPEENQEIRTNYH